MDCLIWSRSPPISAGVRLASHLCRSWLPRMRWEMLASPALSLRVSVAAVVFGLCGAAIMGSPVGVLPLDFPSSEGTQKGPPLSRRAFRLWRRLTAR